MKGSPAKLGTIQGTAGHSSALKMKAEADAASALKDLGHGGHPNMTKSQAAAADHGGKRSLEERKKANTPKQYTNKSFKQAYQDRSDTYKNMSEEDYIKEAKRQKVIHEKTAPKGDPKGGKWDVKESYEKPKKKVVDLKTEEKKVIKKEKTEGKVEAKKPASHKGEKISTEERAKIKAKKLASKVEADEAAGRKGLGSKIRKYRAGRKAKVVEKKYGTEKKVSDPA